MKKTLLFLTMLFALAMPMMADNNPVDIRAYNNGSDNRGLEEIPVSAYIDGHALTVSVNENVGLTRILITNVNGVYIDYVSLHETPDDVILLINHEDLYTVTIILSDGSSYYGVFEVTD